MPLALMREAGRSSRTQHVEAFRLRDVDLIRPSGRNCNLSRFRDPPESLPVTPVRLSCATPMPVGIGLHGAAPRGATMKAW